MMNDIETIEINRDMKLHLLGILKKGYITRNDVQELGKLTGIETITIEVIDRREQVESAEIKPIQL